MRSCARRASSARSKRSMRRAHEPANVSRSCRSSGSTRRDAGRGASAKNADAPARLREAVRRARASTAACPSRARRPAGAPYPFGDAHVLVAAPRTCRRRRWTVSSLPLGPGTRIATLESKTSRRCRAAASSISWRDGALASSRLAAKSAAVRRSAKRALSAWSRIRFVRLLTTTATMSITDERHDVAQVRDTEAERSAERRRSRRPARSPPRRIATANTRSASRR